ncbi:TWiK family of potassium channels protein 7-like [Cydia amplana]|uniref:TWiK family of potassium channels protein 7-like n=1 Tax=Cydia amplana TaxID=1869771 RepID=UPI002FE617B3
MAGCCGGAGCGARRGASPRACLAACALVLLYNLLGGFLFLALEGGEESAVAAVATGRGGAAALRARTVERLWALTEDLNILYKDNWTRLAARELLEFQRGLAGPPPPPRAVSDPFRWTFSTSFLYALTLITTIGHGDVAPTSAAGRACAVLYAVVGIPLVMLYLATLGAALARAARRLYARLTPAPPANRIKDGDEKRTPFQAALNLDGLGAGARICAARARRVPAALSVALLALYVALGAALFARTERWSLLDGCYFSFSSLATIGFGALRPGRAAAARAAAGEAGAAAALDAAVGACAAYILVGVAVVAAAFDLLQEELRAALRGAGTRCGARRTVHSAEQCVAPS